MIKEEWKTFNYANYIQKIYFVDGKVHKLDGPAIINYTKINSNEFYVDKELWYKNDIQHRDDNKPAVKIYNKFGNLLEIRYFVEGKRHKDNGASVIFFYDNGNIHGLKYYKNNILNNSNKPSDIEFYNNGKKKHEIYCLNNRIHRNNGPAVIEYYEDGTIKEERYYRNGDLHRVDGPANIFYNKKHQIRHCSYYINNTQINKDEYNKFVETIQNKKIKRSINKFGFLKFKIVYELVKYYGDQELIDLFENRLIIEKMKN